MPDTQRLMKPKHIPQRSCVACRTAQGKHDLVRLVRTPEGEIVVDPTGKLSGRGAYLCPRPDCLRAAQKRKSLDRALAIGQSTRGRETVAHRSALIAHRYTGRNRPNSEFENTYRDSARGCGG